MFAGLQFNPMVGVESDTDEWRSLHAAVIDFFAAPPSQWAVIVHRDSDSHDLHGPVPDLVIEYCKLVI